MGTFARGHGDPSRRARTATGTWQSAGTGNSGGLSRVVAGCIAALVVTVSVLVVMGRSEPEAGTTRSRVPDESASDQRSAGGFDGDVDSRFADLPAYRGSGFANALQEEQRDFAARLVPDETTLWASPDYRGRYTNVEGGERRTRRPHCGDCPRVDLWWVGGSAAFGLGQRDGRTVASELVRLAEADGIGLDVSNLGVPGWTIWQEERLVSERLTATDGPDLVLSYGGYNDAMASFVAEGLGSADPAAPSILDGRAVGRLVDAGFAGLDRAAERRAAVLAAEKYAAARDRIATLVEARGGEFVSFLHPDALGSGKQFAPIRRLYRGLPPVVAPSAGRVLQRFASAVDARTVDLRDLFDDEPRSVFVDWAHTNEVAARVAAAQVYARIRPSLVERAA